MRMIGGVESEWKVTGTRVALLNAPLHHGASFKTLTHRNPSEGRTELQGFFSARTGYDPEWLVGRTPPPRH
jgi:hypothetical protein